MPDIHPDLLVTQEAVLDEEILQSFAPSAGIRRFKTLAEVRQGVEGSVVIISAEQARAVLSRRKAEADSSTLKFSVVLWLNDPDQKLDRALLDHPQVAGALDANGKLYFRLWQNASTGATSNAQKTLVGDYSIAGYVAREGKAVMLEDAYSLPPNAPYQFNPASDRSIGYRTKSLMTVPLKNKADEVVGVLQLINRKENPETLLRRPEDFENDVQPFDEQDRSIALALAGQ